MLTNPQGQYADRPLVMVFPNQVEDIARTQKKLNASVLAYVPKAPTQEALLGYAQNLLQIQGLVGEGNEMILILPQKIAGDIHRIGIDVMFEACYSHWLHKQHYTYRNAYNLSDVPKVARGSNSITQILRVFRSLKTEKSNAPTRRPKDPEASSEVSAQRHAYFSALVRGAPS